MTLPEAIEKNKHEANRYISILNHHIEKERRSFFLFRDNQLIRECEYDLYRLKELIRASDKLGLAFSNAHYALTEINKLGRTVTNSTQTHQPTLGYGYDNRFDILYRLLEKKIQKREEFVACISQYNDIVLSYMGLNRKEIMKGLSLATIDFTPNNNPQKQISSNSSYTQKLSFNGTIQVKNETKETVDYSFSYKDRNHKTQLEAFGQIKQGDTLVFSCQRQFYSLLIQSKGSTIMKNTIFKTTKAGYNYKIIFNRKNKMLTLISND